MICKECEKKPLHRGVKQVKCFKCGQIVMINSAFSFICKECSNMHGVCQYCGRDIRVNNNGNIKRIKYEVEITYDERVDMGYIYLTPDREVEGALGKDPFIIDLNINNQLLGIEVFDASLHFPENIMKMFKSEI